MLLINQVMYLKISVFCVCDSSETIEDVASNRSIVLS